MSSARLRGCTGSRFARRVSAGGKVEEPSEVNSSTRTGVRFGCGVCAATEAGRKRKTPNKATAMAKERSCDMKSASWLLELRSNFKLHPDKRISVKQLKGGYVVRMAEPVGIYISVPFCKAKCTFCNFASGVFGAERMQQYVNRLCEEIRRSRTAAQDIAASLPRAVLPRTVDTVYFGGGTPSLLSAQQFRKIFQHLRGEFELATDAEITFECAPGQ